MHKVDFVEDLISELHEVVGISITELEKKATSSPVDQPQIMLKSLLKAALRNEWETAMLSSVWALNEENTDFSIQLIRLAGDEAKHYLAIEKLLDEKTVMEQNKSPLFSFLISLDDTFSRIVCGPFVREYLAVKRNRLFLDFCQQYEFFEVLKSYQSIQEDELFHHELGIQLLKQMNMTNEQFQMAQQLIKKMMKTVDDMQEMAVLKKGLKYLPGC